MCIIACKPSGVAMPDIKTLRHCWEGNNDGAGISYWKVGMDKVEIIKGFMKFNKLRQAVNDLNFTQEDIVVIHFRYATHGLVDGGNTHPFPLSAKIEELRSCQWQGECAISHNGVFGSMPCHETLSDTQKFISGIMCNEAIINNLDNKAVQELLGGYCGSSSKLAILRPGKLLMIGHFIEDKGLFYSNHDYKPIMKNVWTAKDNDDLNDFMDGCVLCGKMKDLEYWQDEDVLLCKVCAELNLRNNRGMYLH